MRKKQQVKQLSVAELVELVKGKKPPVLRTSTKVFMRMYPETFLLTTSLRSDRTNVELNKDMTVPLFI